MMSFLCLLIGWEVLLCHEKIQEPTFTLSPWWAEDLAMPDPRVLMALFSSFAMQSRSKPLERGDPKRCDRRGSPIARKFGLCG